MKRILLIPALLLGTMAMANDYAYEISPMVGYNMAEGNVGIKGDDHFLGGVELQYNLPDSKFSPEFSVLYSPDVDNDNGTDTSVTRALINGVYTLDSIGSVVPFVKAGAGYEFVGSDVNRRNLGGVVFDAAAGVKVPLTPSIAFKAEAMYLAKAGNNYNVRVDNNAIVLAGLNFAFGERSKPAPVEEAPVDGDDDNDGVLNSQDNCVDTPAGTKVDALGCAIPVAVVEVDSDKDGVLDAADICPNTPMGQAVNVDGCQLVVNLEINFANNSAVVPADVDVLLQKYADFLNKYTNYDAKIVGYTDSRGSAKYNQKLSEMRANAVVDALVAKGVNPSQLSAMGAGEANPIATNETAEGRAANRRIEAELTRN
jgi:OOP family OmpA-OmpF porin